MDTKQISIYNQLKSVITNDYLFKKIIKEYYNQDFYTFINNSKIAVMGSLETEQFKLLPYHNTLHILINTNKHNLILVPRQRRLMYFMVFEILYKIIYEKPKCVVFDLSIPNYTIESILRNIQILPYIITPEVEQGHIKLISNINHNECIIYNSLDEVEDKDSIDFIISDKFDRNIDDFIDEYNNTNIMYRIYPEQYEKIDKYKSLVYIPEVQELFYDNTSYEEIIKWFNTSIIYLLRDEEVVNRELFLCSNGKKNKLLDSIFSLNSDIKLEGTKLVNELYKER